MTHSDHVVAMETVSEEKLREMLAGLEGLDGGLTYQLPGDIRSIISEVLASRLAKQGWQGIESAPYACHVLATRWSQDDAEWIIDVVMSPPSRPWTHWQPLPAAPSPVLGEPK